MSRRKKIIVGLASVAVLGGVAWELLRPRIPDPIYEGHPLSYWLEGWRHLDAEDDAATHRESTNAVRHIGTNAIPLLLHYMRARDSALKRRLTALAERQSFVIFPLFSEEVRHIQADWGFEALGPDGKDAVPELMRLYQMNLSFDSQCYVIEALGSIGPSAKQAIPLLLGAATNSTLRARAIHALAKIKVAPEVIVPALIGFVNNPKSPLDMDIIRLLGTCGPEVKAAVPRLINLRNDYEAASSQGADQSVKAAIAAMRDEIDKALRKIDPEAAANAGIQVTNAAASQ